MPNLTAPQLTLLRSRPHKTDLHLSVYAPPVVFRAQINNASAAAGDTTITYDNVTTGVYTNIIAGTTLHVGTLPNGRDLGRVRVRSATSTAIKVAENSDIVWTDNLYLTIVDFHEPWAVYPTITLNASNVPTFYKDKDIAYSDQNSVFDPIVKMGPHLAAILSKTTGLAGLYFDASASYDLNAAGTISSYAWTFPSGSITSSAAATPGYVYWSQPGHYTVKLVVTNNNGKSFTAYRHVSIYTDYGGASPPIKNWGLDNLSGDYDRGGWSCRVWFRQDASESVIVDGALVVIFADDVYGSTQQSIGGQYVNRENIVFVGYVMDGTVDIDPTTSIVSFDVVNLALKMDVSEVFSVSVTSSTAPTTWYQLKNMTVDLAVYHYLRWHTTVYEIADVNRNGDTLYVQFADFSREPMRSALNSFLSTSLFATFSVDRQGQIWTEKDLDIVEVADRTVDSTFTLTRHDWRGKLDITIRRIPPSSYVELGGINYTGPTVNTFSALISSAPGTAPKYTGRTSILNGLVLATQSKTNQLAGNVLAKLNNKYPEIRVLLAGNYRNFDIVPQQRLHLSLTAADNYAGIVWSNKKAIPRSVSFQYNRKEKTLLTDLVLAIETDGTTGVAGPYPATVPDDVPDFSFDPIVFPDPPVVPGPIGGEAGDGNTVYFATGTNNSSRVLRTRNWLSTSPNWLSVGSGMGNIMDFVLDPWDPKNRAWLVSTSGVWRTQDLDAITPVWTQIKTNAQIASDLGIASINAVNGICGSITEQNSFWILIGRGNFPQNLYIGHTHDNGATWTYSGTITGWDNSVWSLPIVVSTHGTGLVAGSGDRNDSWFLNWGGGHGVLTAGGNPGGFTQIIDINVPHSGNTSDQIMFIGVSGVLYKSTNGGVTLVDKSPAAGWGPMDHYTIHTYTQDGLKLAVLARVPASNQGSRFYFSSDGGDTWVLRSTFAVNDNCRALGGWPYNVNQFEMWSPFVGPIFSTDGGYTWVNKGGDGWGPLFDTNTVAIRIVPVWVA